MIVEARVSSVTRRPPAWDGGDQFDVVLAGRLPDISRLGEIEIRLSGLTEEESTTFRPGYVVKIPFVATDERRVAHKSGRFADTI